MLSGSDQTRLLSETRRPDSYHVRSADLELFSTPVITLAIFFAFSEKRLN
jgi:hypothetical protein